MTLQGSFGWTAQMSNWSFSFFAFNLKGFVL